MNDIVYSYEWGHRNNYPSFHWHPYKQTPKFCYNDSFLTFTLGTLKRAFEINEPSSGLLSIYKNISISI